MGWIAAVGERRATTAPPAPPFECVGIPVVAGANLHDVISSTSADTYCLAAGTYELGTTPLAFANGTKIVGQPVTFGPVLDTLTGARTVSAPTKIHGTGDHVIQAETGDMTLTLENLEIFGAQGPPNTNLGRGINGNAQNLINLTVRNCKIHSNGTAGISGVGHGLRVYNSEISNNGSGGGGTDAGIKTVHYAEIYDTLFDGNSVMGMWWDCDAPGGIILRSRVVNTTRTGIFVEISAGDATAGSNVVPNNRPLPAWGTYGFRVEDCWAESNNTTSQGGHGGIGTNGSMNVTFLHNTARFNNNNEIYAVDGGRAGFGHAGCSSGFCMQNILIQDNTYGPGNIAVTANSTACGAIGSRVTQSGNVQV